MADSSTTTTTTDAPTKPKIVLHWLEKSRAQRIAWLLEELNLEYEIKPYKRVNQLAPPELKAIHPLGKSPILEIDTLTLAESGFITEYLTSQFTTPLLQPPQSPTSPASPDLLQYKYLLHYAEGSLMLPLMIGYIFSSIHAKSPFFLRPIVAAISRGLHESYLNPTYEAHFAYLEGLLEGGKREWFVGGEFSGADVLLSFPLGEARKAGKLGREEEGRFPGLWKWLDRCQAREGYRRAEERTKGLL